MSDTVIYIEVVLKKLHISYSIIRFSLINKKEDTYLKELDWKDMIHQVNLKRKERKPLFFILVL